MGSKHHAFSELQRLWRYRRQPEGVKILTVLMPNETLHTARPQVLFSPADWIVAGVGACLLWKKPEVFPVRSEEGQASPLGARGMAEAGEDADGREGLRGQC